jgi:hypothetical protein
VSSIVESRNETVPASPTEEERVSRTRRVALRLAGPALIVAAVLFALRGFVFQDLLSNQHPDLLAFVMPRLAFLGRSLASGHVPLWNPFDMTGTPYAADPQSGWLYAAPMLLFSTLSPGAALRAFIAFNPLLAGLGLFWFLRREGLGRPAATAGGLSMGLAMSTSLVAISLPFAGALAWTTMVLVGAGGYASATTATRRLLWLALAAFAWSQVAGAHMSHGLVMGTGAATAYLAARAVSDVRAGRTSPTRAAGLVLGFLAFLPLASMIVFLPRLALIARSSLRGGYTALGVQLARAAGIQERPLMTNGVWSGWPLALGNTPGAYVGATILLGVPLALRARAHRALVWALGLTGIVGYALTMNMLVDAAWFRTLMLRLPFGDVYLHNPGRFRYLALLVVPALGAVGIQGLIDRPMPWRRTVGWMAAGLALWLVVPVALGADPVRYLVLVAGLVCAAIAILWLTRGRRFGPVVLVGVLAVELLGSAVYSQVYDGGTVFLGLESADNPNLMPQPLRWPAIAQSAYTTPGPITHYLESQSDRYLTWSPPAAYFEKGYLFAQKERDWPGLANERASLFGVYDTLGYNPVQLPRYWSYIRATNRLSIFYNASVIQLPSLEDVRLLGARYLLMPRGVQPPLAGQVVQTDGGWQLFQVSGAEPLVSVVPDWRVTESAQQALRAVLATGFDPAVSAVIERDPGIRPMPGTSPGTAHYRELTPEDVRVDVEASGPSLVLLRDNWDKGWSATVDGKPVEVLRADYFRQAVPVEAGHHEIRLTYSDPNVGRGLAASAAIWLLWAIGLGAAMVMQRRSAARAGVPPAEREGPPSPEPQQGS